jgi:hypothetical protein
MSKAAESLGTQQRRTEVSGKMPFTVALERPWNAQNGTDAGEISRLNELAIRMQGKLIVETQSELNWLKIFAFLLH